MKKILFSILLLMVIVDCQAQRKLKYKDIFDLIGKESPELSFMKLSEFQQQEPEFINTYFQTALVNFARLKNTDPFTNPEQNADLLYETKLYIGLTESKLNADDKEVKKNKEYYSNVKIISDMNMLEQADVTNYLKKVRQQVDEYAQNVNQILTYFNRTVNKYNYCINLYGSIVKTESNYKNLLMNSSEKLKKNLSNLSLSFDSVIYFFNEYKAALGNYPIKDYNQTTEIIPIKAYRLDGLTRSDFLGSVVKLWDYHQWVSSVFDSMNGDIKNIKSETSTQVAGLRGIADNALKNNILPDFAEPDRKLMLKIEKLDYKSMLSSCLNFETAFTNVIIASKKQSGNINDSTSLNEPYSKKSAYYYDLLTRINTCKKYINEANQRFESAPAKYSDFVQKEYPAVKNFTLKENYYVKTLADIESQSLENYKFLTLKSTSPSNTVSWKGAVFKLGKTDNDIEHTASGNYGITGIKEIENKEHLFYGFYKTSSGAQAFAGITDSKGQISKIHTLNTMSDFNETAVDFFTCGNGYIGVIASYTEQGIKSYVELFDTQFKLIKTIETQSNQMPVKACYDEFSEKTAIAFKNNDSEDLNFEIIDIQLKSIKQSDTIKLNGTIADIFKNGERFTAVCNFNMINSNDISFIGNNDIAFLTTDADTTEIKQLNQNSTEVLKVNIINGQTVNILGLKGNKQQAEEDKKPVYILTDKKGNIL